MKLSRSLLLCFFIALITTGCKLLLPKQYDEAETHFTAKQYDRAIQSYQMADKESPNNNHIKQGLVKAYSHKAIALYEDAKSRPAEDIDNKIDLYKQAQKANSNAKQTISQLIIIEPLKPEISAPSSRPGQLLLPPNSDEMEYTAQIKLYQKTLSKHKAYVAEALMEEEKSQASVIAGLKEAIALRKQKPDGPIKAYEAYKPFDKYAKYMKKANKAKNAIERTAINFYEARGLHKIGKNHLTSATKDFKAAQNINKASAQATAGLLAVTAKKQLNKKKYEDAYKSLEQIHKEHPKSKFYAKHINKVRTQVVNRGLAKGKKLSLTPSINDKAKAFDIYHELQTIAAPSKPLTTKVNIAIGKLQDLVARNLTDRAIVLNAKNSFAYSSNISALLTSAHGFSNKAALPFKQMAYRANQITSEKLAMPVLFTTQGNAAKSKANFKDWLNEEVYSSIPKLGIKNVSASDAFDLPSKGANINKSNAFKGDVIPFDHTEVLFMLDLKKHQFQEKGRDRPKRKSSKYVSKRYMVHNDNWDRAKRNLDQAERLHEDAQEAAEELYRICKREAERALQAAGPFGGVLAGGLCRMGTSELTAALTGLNDARDEFRNTPKKIEKKEISRYRYDEYTVSVKGEMSADLYAYDRRNKKKIKLEPIKLTINESGKIFKNVKREDVNGIKNGEKNVPDIDAEIQKREQSVFKHVRSQMAQFLEDHNWKRYCYQGEALSKKGLDHAAADAFSQCIEMAPKSQKDSKTIIAANKSIQDYMGFSPAMIAKYGANKNYQDFAKNKYELSDREITAAKEAATFAYISRPTIKLPKFNLNREIAALKRGNNKTGNIAGSLKTKANTQTVSFETPAQ